MAAVVSLLVIAAVVFWFWRNMGDARTAKREAEPAPRTRRAWFGFGKVRTELDRVADKRLLATILMQQLVRTGAPVTSAEKAEILALMADPLRVADPEVMYAKAWDLTDRDRSFNAVAENLLPKLRAGFSQAERSALIDMLERVAGAYGGASDLQIEAIARLEQRLIQPAAVS